MSKEIKIGCGASSSKKNVNNENKNIKNDTTIIEEEKSMIRVGKPAPTFTAQAFHEGDFTEVNLEDYKGKWVLLCFYPGDFTFV